MRLPCRRTSCRYEDQRSLGVSLSRPDPDKNLLICRLMLREAVIQNHIPRCRSKISFSLCSSFDRNSLLGGVNIPKGKLRVKGFLSEHLAVVGGFSAGVRGNWGVEVRRGRFQLFGEAPQAFLRLILAHRFLPPPILLLFLWLKVSIPGIVGVTIDVYRLKYCIDG